MKTYEATERAYKNGYKKGYEDGKRDAQKMTVTCKLGEKGCWNDGKCRATSNCQHKVLTNADRIRAMSDEELANWLARTQYANMMEAAEIFGAQLPFEEETLNGSEQECLQWLKQPAEGE